MFHFLTKMSVNLVTCIGDKIEIIDTKNESKVLRSCRVNGWTTCLAVREGEIFIGLFESQTVLVFNNDLKETKTIRIKGIQDGDWPYDLQVIKDTVFVSTAWPHCRALSLSVYDGSTVSEYTDTTGMYSNALSIAVSEEMNLVAVLWSKYPKRGIIVYSLNKNKSFLVFDVNDDVTRIRISDRDRMIITGNQKTGEIKMYDLEQLFSFEGMKRTLACIVSPKECEELRKYFGVTEKEIGRLEAGDEDKSKKLSDKEKTVKKMKCLLTVIEEKGHLNPYNVNKLTDAVSALGDHTRISDLKGPTEGYSTHSKHMNMKIAMTEMMTRQKAWEDERNQLSSKLETAESKVKEHEKTLDDLQGELLRMTNKAQEQEKTLREDVKSGELKINELKGERLTLKEELQQSSKQIETLTGELEQIQMKSAKEIKTLTDQLKQSKTESDRQIETLTEVQKQIRLESTQKIETLTEELEQTQLKSATEKETLTEELKQIKQSKTESDRQIETLTEAQKQIRLESTQKIETLTEELEQTQLKSATEKETLKEELKWIKRNKAESDRQIQTLAEELKQTKQTLRETAQDRDNTRTELKQYQLDFAKESKALKEVLNQAKEAIAELKRPVDKPSVDSEEPRDEGDAILAAEFGRLTVAIAEHLTLDDCLQLVKFCRIPASDCDTVLCVSMMESPGMKLLDVLKKRKVINIFDVTNLQKALAFLHLDTVNRDLVEPYQNGIDIEQYELHKVEEMYTWEQVNAFVNASKDASAQRQIRDGQTSATDDTEPEYASQTEAAAQLTEAGDKGRGHFIRGRHHELYTENSIGREGGTIQLANVSLTVPPDALHEKQVIALSVMNESPFPLDREVDTARMTPLIKLEPLGLMFKKSLQLNVPHSALISEPENHDVIIYSGQIKKNKEDSSDSIRWTEERSIPRQLKEKSVTADIQCLTYLSASLVSQTSAPPLHIVRAVPFVDGVRTTDDDIILTICFCSDNDSEYNMLLSDYQTKLPLEQYSTLQLHRHSERDEDDAGFLSVTVTSVNNTYVPDMEQAVKRFAVSHLCTASRVSHQLRLKKNQDKDRDVVDILLTFSQAKYEPTQISLKARIKDLIISEESEKLLFGSATPGKKMYEDMVVNISSSLDTEKCSKLAKYFQLTSEDTEMIISIRDPGMMLMKTLKERSWVDSQKMIHFFEGLKACRLDETAKLVSEYISKISKFTYDKKQKPEEDKNTEEAQKDTQVPQYLLKKGQEPPEQSAQTKKVLAKVTSSYTPQSDCEVSLVEGDIIEITSQRDPFWWEGVVNGKQGHFPSHCVVPIPEDGEERMQQDHAAPVSYNQMLLQAEALITQAGGTVEILNTGVELDMPPNALPEGMDECLIKIRIIPLHELKERATCFSSNSSVVVELLPNHLLFRQPVRLTLPHCLHLRKGTVYEAKIFMSQHSEGEMPQWVEQKDQHYRLFDTTCMIWTTTFCWKKFQIDDKIVEGKRLKVYAAAKKMYYLDKEAAVEIGYHLDMPGKKELLEKNPDLILATRKSFVFLKNGRHSLYVNLDRIIPGQWKNCEPERNPKEIPFDSVAASIEYSCPFLVAKETEDPYLPMCEFTAMQLNDSVTLVIRPETASPSLLSDQSVQTTLSSSCVSSDVHVKTLTNEGYTEHEVVEALDISRNRLVMARKVLQCLGEQSDVSPVKDFFLHKEQYIDENGGEITLREANVHLLIPVGAVSKASIVSLTMMTSKQGNVFSEGKTLQLSPVIKVGPEGSTLMKAASLRIPHCASETEGITSTDILLGFSSNGEEIQWRKRKQHEPAPSLKKDHLEVYLQTFCAISPNITVDLKKPLGKRLRVLPLINRVKKPTDDLIFTLWFYNDDETEHMNLLHEEINVRSKIQLHDFKRFTLKSSEKEREVHIKSESSKITLHSNINMKKVISTTLWHNTRHAVEFHFKNKEGIADISFRLRLCTRQVLRTVVDLQFDIKVTLSELLQKPKGSIRALLTTQGPHPAMEKSFQELVSKLSGELDVDSCLEIAGIFRLSSDLKDRVKESSEPGKVIFDELIQEQLITAASVSTLDVALTRTGNVSLAEDVKAYRHRNATFPTTIFTLL